MRYLTLFPEAENIHLIKDVGMIPFSLHRHCNYEATLACYKNGDYHYLAKEVAGLKIIFLKKFFRNTFLDCFLFILFNARKFDVLQTFHFRLRSLLWLFIFKVFNPSGKTYLKLDASEKILKYSVSGLKGKLKIFLLKRINVISVESTILQEILSKKWGLKINYIPNGFLENNEELVAFEQKENVILTVGRIGAPEKRTDLLLEAFITFVSTHQNWKLELVGPIESGFASYIENYFESNPQLRGKIIFSGAIQDRDLLYTKYATAKIFCLTSQWESFGIALIEALSAGCYIVSSAVLAAKDITDNEHFGSIFPVDDLEALTKILVETASDSNILMQKCISAQLFAKENFSWSVIVKKLDSLLKQ